MTAPKGIVTQKDMSKATIARMVRSGKLRHLGKGFYSSDTDSPEHHLTRREWVDITEPTYHGGVLVGVSAMRKMPDQNDTIHIEHPERSGTIEIPGLRIEVTRGAGPSEYDKPIRDGSGLYLASPARVLNDALAPGRAAHRVDAQACEAWMHRMLRTASPSALEHLEQQIRDVVSSDRRAKALSTMRRVFKHWDGRLPDSNRRARAHGGETYDMNRVRQFGILRDYLASTRTLIGPPQHTPSASQAFYEAYFSNYIEGTEFDLDEAHRIIYQRTMPADRPQDGHFIDATFKLANDAYWRAKVPEDADEFMQMLQDRHFLLMSDVNVLMQPAGQFKTSQNTTASGILFVKPDEVEGTLSEGWNILNTLKDPFKRAVLMKYIIEAVHPFEDGNGRTSRLFMNAELEHGGESRLVLPSALRYRHLEALRAMENEYPNDLVQILLLAHRWTTETDWTTWANAKDQIGITRAADEYDEDSATLGATLRLLSEMDQADIMAFSVDGAPSRGANPCSKTVNRTQKPCLLSRGHSGRCRSTLPSVRS